MSNAIVLEKLLSVKLSKEWQCPDNAVRCYEEIVSRFALPDDILSLLVSSRTADIEVVQIMKAFKLYSTDFTKVIALISAKRGLAKGTETNEVLLRMYGVENSRNFLLAIASYQLAYGKKFEWSRELSDPKISPKEILHYALTAQKGYEGRASDLTFSSGFVFDVLRMTADVLLESPLKAKTFIAQTFEQGVREAKIGMEVSRKINDLKLSDYVYGACILSGVGRAIAAILREEATELFYREGRDSLPPSFAVLCEEKLYGVSSDFYGALICSYLPPLKPIQEAFQFLRKPYLLDYRGKHDLANLAKTVFLAHQIAQHTIVPGSDEDDPAFILQCKDHWLTAEVKELGLTTRDLFQVATKIQG